MNAKTNPTGPSVGAAGSVELLVSQDDTALALGSGDVPVLGTPRVIALVEQAACRALSGTIADERTTVGTRIELDHLAPSPVGSTVIGTATVVAAEGRSIDFEVEATMDGEVVARGTHRRAVVRREAFGG